MSTINLDDKLRSIDARLEKTAIDGAYNRGRLDEIAVAVSQIAVVVEKQRTIRNSLRHAWISILLLFSAVGALTAKIF